MPTIQELKARLLSETIAHYKLGNRGVDKDRRCVYENEDGCRCAIGRVMTDAGIASLREQNLIKAPLHGVIKQDVFTSEWKPLLNDDYHLFLLDIQALHDKEDNWTTKGISAEGKTRAAAIKKAHQLD